MMNNPYEKFVSEYARLLKEGKTYQLGDFPQAPERTVDKEAPRVLLFSPHPDDECVIGALPLRLLREQNMRVINVAVTLGSKKERQLERADELKNSCAYLGFDLMQTAERGLEKINLKTREQDQSRWSDAVAVIAEILTEQQPGVVFFPHEHDANSTHTGTRFLIVDALKTIEPGFFCWICETEFWMPLGNPNLMIESSSADVTDLITATSFHVGEVKRNPYHLRLPAWMQDNVRRGGELIGGQGEAAPEYIFATLYRIRKWAHSNVEDIEGGRLFSSSDSLENLFVV